VRLRTLRNVDLKGKRVLYRVDYNVPLTEDLKVRDDTRIRETIPTINYMREKGAKIIILSHLGRPKGERKKEFSLKPVRDKLSELLNYDVRLIDDIYSDEAKEIVNSLRENDIVMFENLRFYPEEEKNVESFAEKLSEFGDIYVSDAFAVSHRENTSVFLLPCMLPSYAGFLLEKEVNLLSKLIENPEKPYIIIIGGAKVSDKIGVLKNLVNKVDSILIGGGAAFTFLKAEGYNIGSSIYEREMEVLAKEIMDIANKKNVKILLPVDVHVTEELKEGKDHEIVPVEKIPYDWYGVDIGPKTIEIFKEEIKNAKTIFWSGPLGVYEMDLYSVGTKEIAKAISEVDGIKVIGGGDTISAVNKFGYLDKMTHVSTGGGALLEFLEGKVLPGIKVLLEDWFMYDLIIIGGGPAGLTSSIYAKRFGLKTLLIEKFGTGGQASLTDLIENYPGFPEGISGVELATKFTDQAKRFEVEIINDEVVDVEFNETKRVKTINGLYESIGVIIATGASPKKLGVPGEKEFTGRGVSYCAVCDAYFYRNKDVVVVGGGDSALTEALYLTKFVNKLYLVHRRDKFRGSQYLQERIFKNDKIEILFNSEVVEIKGEKRVEKVVIFNKGKNENIELDVKGVFIYIGLTPNSEIFKNKLNLDESGFIITDEEMRTNIKFVYAAGDVRKKSFRQIITACSDGAIAANTFCNDLCG